MRTPSACLLAGSLVLAALPLTTRAQGFSSGSDGRDGDLIVATGTRSVTLPPDGILRFRSVNIAANAVVTFVPNELNTPVYLLVQQGFTNAGTIRLNGAPGTATAGGAGGPGGFAGGAPSVLGQPPGRGHGPGGGGPANGAALAGKGGFQEAQTPQNPNDGSTYGSEVLVPLIGGSGGGGGPALGGGGGGGALLVASSQQIVLVGTGRIQALSGNGSVGGAGPGSGSGGAVRLVAPRIDTLASNVRAVDVSDGGTVVSGGRVRLDTMDLGGIKASAFPPAPVTSVGNLMAVFPPAAVTPSLDIARIGPSSIAGGTRVDITLPAASAATQPVVVRARNLDRATLVLALIPNSGPASISRVPIAGSDVEVTVNATFPLNKAVAVEAWSE